MYEPFSCFIGLDYKETLWVVISNFIICHYILTAVSNKNVKGVFSYPFNSYCTVSSHYANTSLETVRGRVPSVRTPFSNTASWYVTSSSALIVLPRHISRRTESSSAVRSASATGCTGCILWSQRRRLLTDNHAGLPFFKPSTKYSYADEFARTWRCVICRSAAVEGNSNVSPSLRPYDTRPTPLDLSASRPTELIVRPLRTGTTGMSALLTFARIIIKYSLS